LYPYRVFVSYSRVDSKLVDRLHDHLVELNTRRIRMFVCVFHLLLTPERFANLESSPIEMLIPPYTATNSLAVICNRIRIVSIATLFCRHCQTYSLPRNGE
jgi:hypothetical protein